MGGSNALPRPGTTGGTQFQVPRPPNAAWVVSTTGTLRYEVLVESPDSFSGEAGDARSAEPEKPAERAWQPSLFAQGEAWPDPDFSGLVRQQLDDTAWVDHVAGWLR